MKTVQQNIIINFYEKPLKIVSKTMTKWLLNNENF